jgi:hypothetical protein
MKKLYRATSKWYCAGLEVDNGIVVRTAPVLRWALSLRIEVVKEMALMKGCKLEEVLGNPENCVYARCIKRVWPISSKARKALMEFDQN